MRIFATRYFSRFAKHEGLSDEKITDAIEELVKGLHDGNLGGNVYKKRVPLAGRGKRGGARTIVAIKIAVDVSSNAFLLYGYPKNKRDNITHEEEAAFKKLAEQYFAMTAPAINRLLKQGELIEVQHHGDSKKAKSKSKSKK